MESNATCCLNAESYVPPKDWDVLTDSEKIERMREIVKNLSSSNYHMQNRFSSLQRKFASHEHHEGKVVEIRTVHQYDDKLVENSPSQSSKFF